MNVNLFENILYNYSKTAPWEIHLDLEEIEDLSEDLIEPCLLKYEVSCKKLKKSYYSTDIDLKGQPVRVTNLMRLNIRKKLKELDPKQNPSLQYLESRIINLMQEKEISPCFLLVESSSSDTFDFDGSLFETVEAIFIQHSTYQEKIEPYLKRVAEENKILNTKKEKSLERL